MYKFTSHLLLLVLASACSESGHSTMPMDPYSVRVTVMSESGYALEGHYVRGGLYSPILETGDEDCDASMVLHLAPWFRLNLSTGHSTLWSSDRRTLVVLPWYETGVLRAENVLVTDGDFDEDGISITLVDAEFCSDGPSDSLFVVREEADDCESIGEVTIVVESVGDWSTPVVCNEATVLADQESCHVGSHSARVDCPL